MLNLAGSVHSYARSMAIWNKAKLKIESMGGTHTSMKLTSSSDVRSPQTHGGVNTNETDQRLVQIILKMKRGKKLTSDELSYLRRKDKKAYATAMRIERERDEYEKELKKCRTKEEVGRLKTSKMGSFLGEMGSAAAQKDYEAVSEVEMRANAISDQHACFVQGRRYRELPTDYNDLKKRKKRSSNYVKPATADYIAAELHTQQKELKKLYTDGIIHDDMYKGKSVNINVSDSTQDAVSFSDSEESERKKRFHVSG